MKNGTHNHPKMYRLADGLGIRRYAAIGLMDVLWEFARQNTPRGDIGALSNRAIAEAIGWEGDADMLIEILVQSTWLDRNETHRLVIHDWPEHCEYEVHRKLHNQGKRFLECYTYPDPKVGKYEHPRKFAEKRATARSGAQKRGSRVATAKAKALSSSVEVKTTPEPTDSGPPESPPQTKTHEAEFEAAVEQIGQQIHARHPALRRCGPAEAKKRLRAIARKFPVSARIDKLLEINDNHKLWCSTEDWTKERGTYAKGLDNWLAPSMERWAHSPPPESFAPPDGPASRAAARADADHKAVMDKILKERGLSYASHDPGYRESGGGDGPPGHRALLPERPNSP